MGSFLGNLFGKFAASASTSSVDAAMFGKHPAAADHFEYLPPGDDVIREVWNLLYRKSMEELLASWNNLSPTAQLPEFNHVWLWKRGSKWVAGRMWSSIDSGGRAYFPLVICVHGKGPPGDFVLKSVMPMLQRMQAECKKATTLERLRAIVDKAKTDLNARAADTSPPSAQQQALLLKLLDRPEFSASTDETHRMLYPFNTELSTAMSGNSRSTSDSRILSGLVSSLSLRMPRTADSAEASLLGWQSLLDRVTLSGTQTFLIAPVDQPWIDVLSGNISTASLFCIRASLESRRFSTEKADTFPPTFVTLADRFVAETRGINPSDSRVPGKSDPPSSSSTRLLSLILITLLLLGGVGGMLFKRLHTPDSGQVAVASSSKDSAVGDTAPQTTLSQAPATNATVLAIAGAPQPADQHPASVAAGLANSSTDWPINARLDEIDQGLMLLKSQYSVQTAEQEKSLSSLRDRAGLAVALGTRGDNPSKFADEKQQVDTAADTMLKGIQADLQNRKTSVASADSAQKIPCPVKDEYLASSWRGMRDRIFQSAQPPDAQSKGIATLNTFFLQIESQLTSSMVPVPPDSAWSAPIHDRVIANHRHNLELAVSCIGWKDDLPLEDPSPQFKPIAVSDRQFQTSAAAVATDTAAIVKMLDGFCPLSTALSPGADSPSAVYARLKQSPAYSDAGIRAAIDPVVARLSKLAQIDAAANSADLLKATTEPVQSLEVRLARWRKLGSFNDVDFGTTSQLAKSLKEQINSLPDDRQKKSLTAEVDQANSARWVTAMLAAPTPAITRTLMEAEPADVAVEAIESPQIRFDIMLRSLKVKVADGPTDRISPQVTQFIKTLQPPLLHDPSVAALIQKVNALQEQDARSTSDSGPRKSDHWSCTQLPGGIRCTLDGTDLTLDFALVQPKEPATAPFFLEATKFPVALAMKLMEDPQFAAAMGIADGPLTHETGSDSDFLKGPRGWIWKFHDGQPIGWSIPPDWWPANHHPVEGELYAATLGSIDPPSANHPLQQINISMAALLAGKLHCRLPSKAEWEFALANFDTKNPNLRDAAFAKQLKYLTEKYEAGKVTEWLDTGIFSTSDINTATERQALVWDQPHKSASHSAKDVYEDGSLLFRPVVPPVPASGTVAVSDLVGNLCEFAFDQTGRWNEIAQMKPDAASKFFADQSRQCWVIGSSALSAPEMGLTQAHTLAGQARLGFSDVGFRLAFPAPTAQSADQLRALIDQQPFLAPGAKPATRE